MENYNKYDMNITKNKIFSGILLLGLITTLIIFLDIKFFYLRAIFSFIFLTIIPGLLIMLMIKIKKIGFWGYLVYTIGLSITFLMFAGLATNWILPWLHITDKPLSLMPLLISFNILLTIFGYIAYKRNKKLSFKIKFPKLNWLNIIFFVVPVTFPILSVLGAMTLNNGGPNYLTMIMLCGIAIYIFPTILLKNKLNDNIYPWSIFMIASSLLLMISLRSWYISGWDINEEYKVFQITQSFGSWSIDNINHKYNSCLSITILPTIISIFTSIKPEYIFKIVYQLFFAIIPILAYLLANKFFSKITSYIAAIYLVSQPMFIQPMTAIMRQEVAFLFIGLLFIVLLNKSLSRLQRTLLFIIFSVSLVVSHYTTTYIALILLTLIYSCRIILISLAKIFKNTFIKRIVNKSLRTLSIELLIFFLLFTYLWNVQYTKSSENVLFVIRETFKNMINISKEELRSKEVYGYLNFEHSMSSISQISVDSYFEELKRNHSTTDVNYYNPALYNHYRGLIIDDSIHTPKISYQISTQINLIANIIKSLTKILIIPGFLYFIYIFIKKSVFPLEYFLINTISIGLLLSIIILPSLSQQYNIDRLYLQVMFFISAMLIEVLFHVSRLLKENIKLFCISLIISVYFLVNTNIQNQFIGGYSPITLNNFGDDYNKFYTHKTEVIAAQWFSKNRIQGYSIEADSLSSLRLQGFSNITNTNQTIMPSEINPKSYIFTNYTNNIQGRTWIRVKTSSVSVQSPNDFLTSSKSVIYNNNQVKIYK